MIQYVSGDVYTNEDTDIIFNPVGVRDNSDGFSKKVRKLYPKVYDEYHDMVWEYNIKELLGDIQLVYIGNNRFMMNGFCKYRDGKINKLALVKVLVELCNLAYEYKLSVGIEFALGVFRKQDRKDIKMIINEVFKDTGVDVKVYNRI